jgi:hypothetical protein
LCPTVYWEVYGKDYLCLFEFRMNVIWIATRHGKYLAKYISNIRLKGLTKIAFSLGVIQGVLKVALPKYLVVIIRRCQMCIEHVEQQSEQFL